MCLPSTSAASPTHVAKPCSLWEFQWEFGRNISLMLARSLILIAALLVAPLALAQSGNPPKAPKIVTSVELPQRPKDTGPFTTGPASKPIEVTPEQKKKLEELAKTYGDVARKNFDLIVKRLRSTGSVPSTVKIVITYKYKGVAATAGDTIMVDPRYALSHPDDLGMIVHEMAHVVQGYPTYDPGWLVEGIADYVRWFFYEPTDKRPKPNPDRATARDSYQTTGAFLFWASNKYSQDLVPKLHAAFQANTYKEDMFKQITGKTLDELNAEWKEALKAGNP